MTKNGPKLVKLSDELTWSAPAGILCEQLTEKYLPDGRLVSKQQFMCINQPGDLNLEIAFVSRLHRGKDENGRPVPYVVQGGLRYPVVPVYMLWRMYEIKIV